MPVLETIAHFISEHGLEGPALCGFSGGADSTALLLALHLSNVQVTAVHFNHGIRGSEADEDEEWCRSLCKSLGVNFISERLNVPRNTRRGESCEEAARRLRIEAWARLAQGRPVFLAHHADDMLEELFLRLSRGSNASALVPMRPVRLMHGVAFMRPFLGLRKAQLEAWLRSKGISDWRIDSTNADNSYRRNAVRNKMLPLFRELFGNDSGLLLALDSIRQDADFIDDAARRALDGAATLADWRNMHPALLARALRLWLEGQGVCSHITRPFIVGVQNALRSFSGRQLSVQLDAETAVLMTREGPVLRKGGNVQQEIAWDWRTAPSLRLPWMDGCLSASELDGAATLHFEGPMGTFQESFSSSGIPSRLSVRTWRPGDRMTPFGSSRPRKLQDIFTDAKVPRHMRALLPLVMAGDAIIWIPSVKRAEFGRMQFFPKAPLA